MKMSKLTYLIPIIALANQQGMAQDVVASSGPDPLLWTYHNIVLILGCTMLILAMYTVFNLFANLLSLRKAELLNEIGAEKGRVIEELKIPLWKRVYSWAWSMVPVKDESNVDLGHDYDGIRELDNQLPPWWLALFYGSIVFAFVYMWVYHWSGSEWSSKQEYLISMEHAAEMKKQYLATSADAVDETNASVTTDEESLSAGQQIYVLQCAVCHGPDGQGLVGPNFTDQYWINGGGIKDLFSTIKYGVPEKGMISWKSLLRPSEIQNVASYILSLQGTSPPNQKAPEGEIWQSDQEIQDPDRATGSMDEVGSKI